MTKIKINQEIEIPKGIEKTIFSSEEIEPGYIHVRKRTCFAGAFKKLPLQNKIYLGLIAQPRNGIGTRFIIAHMCGKEIIYDDKQIIPLKLPQNFLDTEKRFRKNNKSYNYTLGISNSDNLNFFQKDFRAAIYPIENFI